MALTHQHEVIIMDILYAGVIAAVAMIFLMLKLDIKKICGYDILVDITFTGLLAWMLAGTYSGMMAALIGGAIVSIFLFITKKVNGYSKLTRKGWKTYY
jgi:hypothetical protein